MKTSYTSDKAIIEALKNGEEQAMSVLYPQHYKPIQKWIVQNNGLETDAEDVYQEAIMVFYKKIVSNELDLNCKIGTYLFAVSKNIWLKQLRKQKTTKNIKINPNNQAGDNKEEKLQNDNRIEVILEEVEHLGNPCKTLLQSFYFKKMDMESIAEILNYSNGKRAKSQKYKCMQRLRKAVMKRLNLNTE